jgi:hypothetical protein
MHRMEDYNKDYFWGVYARRLVFGVVPFIRAFVPLARIRNRGHTLSSTLAAHPTMLTTGT